jgi:hypothetical protein
VLPIISARQRLEERSRELAEIKPLMDEKYQALNVSIEDADLLLGFSQKLRRIWLIFMIKWNLKAWFQYFRYLRWSNERLDPLMPPTKREELLWKGRELYPAIKPVLDTILLSWGIRSVADRQN